MKKWRVDYAVRDSSGKYWEDKVFVWDYDIAGALKDTSDDLTIRARQRGWKAWMICEIG